MIRINKQLGETPLAALERFRESHPKYKDVRLSYAGRLDPMASGVLLLLEGEENDRRQEFLGWDKEYEFQILFGVSTDTFDLLGLVTEAVSPADLHLTEGELQKILAEFVGEWEMAYPPYSAQTVETAEGQTPLWQLARAGRLPEQLPTKVVEIYELTCQSLSFVSAQEMIPVIEERLDQVSGDFRQAAIRKCWRQTLAEIDHDLLLADCQVGCSSGTYVRRLVQATGEAAGCPATTFSITRTDLYPVN